MMKKIKLTIFKCSMFLQGFTIGIDSIPIVNPYKNINFCKKKDFGKNIFSMTKNFRKKKLFTQKFIQNKI